MNSLNKSYQHHLLVLCTQTPRSDHSRELINLIRYTYHTIGLVGESKESHRGRVIANFSFVWMGVFILEETKDEGEWAYVRKMARINNERPIHRFENSPPNG